MNKSIKKLIKSYFILTLFSIPLYLFFYLNVSAGPPHPLPPMDTNYVFSNIYYLLIRVSNWLFAFIAVGSLIGVLVGSFMIATSGGDSSKLTNGKKIAIYSLIAVFIASFAFGMVQFANNLLAP